MSIISSEHWYEVAIPKKMSDWFKANRRWPVRANINLSTLTAQLEGGTAYKIYVVKKDEYCFYRVLPNSTVLELGRVSRNGLSRTVSEAASHDLRVFRTVLFGCKYPGPVAYRMANGDTVHVGTCFDSHPSVIIKKTMFRAPHEVLCAICKEGFDD